MSDTVNIEIHIHVFQLSPIAEDKLFEESFIIFHLSRVMSLNGLR